MANPSAAFDYIDTLPGVTPSTDDTALYVQNHTFSDKIRFRKGKPEKIGGYNQISLDVGNAIKGVPRSTWSTEIEGSLYTLIGTDQRLYVLNGSTLTNITPFGTSATTATNSLSTLYGTLANNPISTVIGTNVVKILDANAARFQINDTVTLSGATATGGLTTGNLNAAQVIRSIGSGFYTFYAAANATSTATGGGNAVVRACGLLNMAVVNTLSGGDRVSISGAGDTGGILAAAINLEFIIRNASGTSFDFMTTSTATSAVTAGGGTGTEFLPPIPAGLIDEEYGFGYGVGKYGVGLYGVAIQGTSGRKYPQTWYFDRFGDFIMLTPGNGGALYEWSGDTDNAPVITSGSPSAINFMFVSDNAVIVFGNGGTENQITASDVGNRQTWSGTAQNQFFDAVEAGAGRFIGVIKLQGINLIFTEHQVYTFRYVGLPTVWEVLLLSNVGMISAFAGQEINGIAYWQGLENFYFWAGGEIDVMPSATVPYSTILNYVFENLNVGQKSKCFSWYDKQFQELRWHYPSAASDEPDSVACVNITEGIWWPDTIDRVSAERPTALLVYPRQCDVSGNIYNHESGTDANGASMPFTLALNLRTLGKKETMLTAFIPDSLQTGNITVAVNAFRWPNSPTPINSKTVTVSPNSDRQEVTLNGRFWQYVISGDVLGQKWRMGRWGEEKQMGGDGK